MLDNFRTQIFNATCKTQNTLAPANTTVDSQPPVSTSTNRKRRAKFCCGNFIFVDDGSPCIPFPAVVNACSSQPASLPDYTSMYYTSYCYGAHQPQSESLDAAELVRPTEFRAPVVVPQPPPLSSPPRPKTVLPTQTRKVRFTENSVFRGQLSCDRRLNTVPNQSSSVASPTTGCKQPCLL